MSKDKPCILKKRLNGALDQNAGLINQGFLSLSLAAYSFCVHKK